MTTKDVFPKGITHALTGLYRWQIKVIMIWLHVGNIMFKAANIDQMEMEITLPSGIKVGGKKLVDASNMKLQK